MDEKEIIEAALETFGETETYYGLLVSAVAFARIIEAKTLERAAKECDSLADQWKDEAERCGTQDDLMARHCAEAIRALGEKK